MNNQEFDVELDPVLGQNLRKARKEKYPDHSMDEFAELCDIGRSTYKKMEKGVLSVGMQQYYKAALMLELTESFAHLFESEEDWFSE